MSSEIEKRCKNKLYDAMVNAVNNDLNSQSVQNQLQLAQKIYNQNINELKSKHEVHLEETVKQFTNKWEHLYSYIKEAEKLLEEIEEKRRKDIEEIETKHQHEIRDLHLEYSSQIEQLKARLQDNDLVIITIIYYLL